MIEFSHNKKGILFEIQATREFTEHFDIFQRTFAHLDRIHDTVEREEKLVERKH